MLALGIDTSDGVSVALLEDGQVAARANGSDPRRHAETLAPAVSWVLAEAGVTATDLDAVAVGTGPAPFTGLRVGLVTARSLSRALDIPAHGVCSLDVLARQAFDDLGTSAPRELLVVADARRREVYSARYAPASAADDVDRLTEPTVSAPARLRDSVLAAEGSEAASAGGPGGALGIVGRGAQLYADTLPPVEGGPVAVDAAVLVRIALHRAEHGGELDLEPRYLRRPDVTPPAARKRAS